MKCTRVAPSTSGERDATLAKKLVELYTVYSHVVHVINNVSLLHRGISMGDIAIANVTYAATVATSIRIVSFITNAYCSI